MNISSMKQLLSNACACCGYKGPTSLTIVGPHIRQSCGACGQYVKFIGVDDLPPLADIKRATFEITQDLEYIDRAKSCCGFQVVKTMKWVQMQYYKLYKYIYCEVERKQLYTGELF